MLTRSTSCAGLVVGAATLVLATHAAPASAHFITERVSLGPGSVQGDQESLSPALSAGGRFVAFTSRAANLVPGDSNDTYDVFVRDRQAGTTERVSVGRSGVPGNGLSDGAAISAGGRFVAFDSEASNLVPGDTNHVPDVFVHDRRTGATRRVSLGPGGVQANGFSFDAAISATGRFVAFTSAATNLVAGDTNGVGDVFVHDLQTGTTERVSLGQGGVQGKGGASTNAALSADGRFVAFVSGAPNLVPGDTNGTHDVFVRDRQQGTTERVSLGRGGVQSNGEIGGPVAISADGRFVAFISDATNLVPGDSNGEFDMFVRDRQAGTTDRVSVGPSGVQGNGFSGSDPALSADGRFVAFGSEATNLVSGDTNNTRDVFVRDRQARTTRRVSLGPGGVQGNGFSDGPALSANGRFVAFSSGSSNLVVGDTNEFDEVFVRIPTP